MEQHHQGAGVIAAAAVTQCQEISCSHNGMIDRIGDRYLLTVPVRARGMGVEVGIGAEAEVKVKVEAEAEVVEAEAEAVHLPHQPLGTANQMGLQS